MTEKKIKSCLILFLAIFIFLPSCSDTKDSRTLGEAPLPVNANKMQDTTEFRGDTLATEVPIKRDPRQEDLLAVLQAASKDYKILSLNNEDGSLKEPWWFTGGYDDIGFTIYGERFTITLVESRVDGIFDASEIIKDYISSLPDFKKVTEDPLTSKTPSAWWTTFVAYTLDVESKTVVSLEQFTLVQLVDKAYSIKVSLSSMEDVYRELALYTLGEIHLPGVVYDETVKEALSGQTKDQLDIDNFKLYDATLISGVNILLAIRQFQDKPIGILVKTLKNSATNVLNYGAHFGTDSGVRFNMKNTQIVGTFPDIKYLTTDMMPDAENYNNDMMPLQNLGNEDYVDIVTNFLSYLIYNEQGVIVGIYLEQVEE